VLFIFREVPVSEWDVPVLGVIGAPLIIQGYILALCSSRLHFASEMPFRLEGLSTAQNTFACTLHMACCSMWRLRPYKQILNHSGDSTRLLGKPFAGSRCGAGAAKCKSLHSTAASRMLYHA
jgi:hypothetical protein